MGKVAWVDALMLVHPNSSVKGEVGITSNDLFLTAVCAWLSTNSPRSAAVGSAQKPGLPLLTRLGLCNAQCAEPAGFGRKLTDSATLTMVDENCK